MVKRVFGLQFGNPMRDGWVNARKKFAILGRPWLGPCRVTDSPISRAILHPDHCQTRPVQTPGQVLSGEIAGHGMEERGTNQFSAAPLKELSRISALRRARRLGWALFRRNFGCPRLDRLFRGAFVRRRVKPRAHHHSLFDRAKRVHLILIRSCPLSWMPFRTLFCGNFVTLNSKPVTGASPRFGIDDASSTASVDLCDGGC